MKKREQCILFAFFVCPFLHPFVGMVNEKTVPRIPCGDVFEVADYAVPAMQWACGSGIVSGKNDPDGEGRILEPRNTGTRAEIAAMIMHFCTKIKK